MNHEIVGQLLGFLMAHTAAIGDVLEADELLVPYIIFYEKNTRDSIDFEAESQQDAIEAANEKIEELTSQEIDWSFSQDGLVTLENDQKQDAFLFRVWVKGMTEPLEAYQVYQKYPFKLIGNVQIQNYLESGLVASGQDEFISGLDTGIDAHPTGSEKWESWFE